MTKNSFLTLSSPKFFIPFIIFWLCLLFYSSYEMSSLISYAGFSVLGIIGAIFANSTGAGGGVVFIPMFNQLNFTENQAIATSFSIQCFGMTAGAITWWHHYQTKKTELRLWQGFKRIIIVTSIASVIGLGGTFFLGFAPPATLHNSFSIFSLLLGLFIISTVYLIKPSRERSQIHWLDYFF